jgi:hypothetical protein
MDVHVLTLDAVPKIHVASGALQIILQVVFYGTNRLVLSMKSST